MACLRLHCTPRVTSPAVWLPIYPRADLREAYLLLQPLNGIAELRRGNESRGLLDCARVLRPNAFGWQPRRPTLHLVTAAKA